VDAASALTTTTLAPVASLSSGTLAFGTRARLTTATTLTTVVTNTGNANLVISEFAIRGANAANFTQTNNCTTVVPGASCTFSVTFTPGAVVGAKTAELAFTTNTAVREIAITLTGNVVANSAPTAGPTISDTTPTQGSALTASSASIVDPDGTSPTTAFSFVWQQNNGGTTGFANITPAATDATFTPGAAQVNKRLRVVATYVDNHGTTDTATSAQTEVVGTLITNGAGTLTGTAGEDNITGDAGVNTITGLGSNDIIIGGGGNDSINGGAGDDTISGGLGDDMVDGDAGNDTLSGDEGNDSIIGNGGNDTIRFTGTAGGFDSVTGGAGTDTIVALTDNTVIGLTSVGAVEVVTGRAGVHIAGSAGADTLDFGGATITGVVDINGGDGNDAITGGTGNDTIAVSGTTAGFDSVTGGAGTDTIVAVTPNTVIGLTSLATVEAISPNGQPGVRISGSGVADTLNFANTNLNGLVVDGAAGNDAITGSAAADTILGGLDNDTLAGGAGNDVLEGGAGTDALNGNAGLNTFRYTAATGLFGADTITGFDPNPAGGQDVINLSGYGITTGPTGNFATRVTLTNPAGTGNTLVTVKDATNATLGTITVNGTTPGTGAGQMSVTDFTVT